jgi:Predicted glycosyltransferases
MFTNPEEYELIIVDNSSTDGTVDWLRKQKDVKVIYNNENLGFPKGCNQGIEISTGDNILLLNNDVIVTKYWLDNLIRALYSKDDVGAVGAVTNNCSNHQVVDLGFKDLDEMFNLAAKYNKSNSSMWEQRLKLVGFCMLIRKSIVNEIGGLDERFTPGNYEDDDYSVRIIKSGYKLILCKDTFIYHFGSTSFRENNDKYIILLNKNKAKFIEKWGFDPVNLATIRFDLISMMEKETKGTIKVLDIGCNCGATLLHIKNINPSCELYGIESNCKTAEIAALNSKVQFINSEVAELEYKEEYFDYILCGDVIQQLNDPWQMLKNIRKHLKVDGKLLLSVQNVMYLSIIKSLLNGFWSYEEPTLINKNHIRFFTLEEITRMLETNLFTIKDLYCNRSKPDNNDEMLIKTFNSITGKDLTNQYEAYSYLILAEKQENAERVTAKSVKKTNMDEGISLMKKKVSFEEKVCDIGTDKKTIFFLRRIENNILVEESIKELISLIDEKRLTVNKIEKLIRLNVIKKELILLRIVDYCCINKLNNYTMQFLLKAYEINMNNIDTIYKLGEILFRMGEKELSLQYLRKIETHSELAKQLIKEVRGE